MIENEILEHLETLARAATPGPWVAEAQMVTAQPPTAGRLFAISDLIAAFAVVYVGTPPDTNGLPATDSIRQGEANAAFVAAANPATVLALIAALRFALTQIESYA